MSQHAKAVIRYAVLGRKDAGLKFCRNAFYRHVDRSACAIGACGFTGMQEAASELGVHPVVLQGFVMGWDANSSHIVEYAVDVMLKKSFPNEHKVLSPLWQDMHAFGLEMAALAFGES